MTNLSTPTIDHISAKIRIENLSNSLEFIENLAKEIISDLNLNVLKKIDHKFDPVGRTMVFVLSESHLALHTWPENQLLHVDLVSCGGAKIIDFDKTLAHSLRNTKVLEYKSEAHSI